MTTLLNRPTAAILIMLACAGCHPPAAAVETRQLLNRGEIQAARVRIDAAVKQQPADAELRRVDIDVHMARGDRSGALKAYRSWLDRRGKDLPMARYLALSVLRWGLAHRDAELRLVALQGARRTDADELEQPVAARLQDPDEVVRTWAAVALSRTPAGADVLQRQLRSPKPEARAVAVGNLGRIAGKAALAPLQRFVDDRSAAVRAALARGLVEIGGDGALGLLSRLAGDRDRSVRLAAINALGRLRLARAARFVRSALDDSYIGVRLAAVLALAEIEGQAARPKLREVAAGGDLPAALRAGVRLARMHEDQPVLDAIAKALVDKQWTVRAAGCNAGASLAGHRVARKLIADTALRDPEPRVRIAAARAVLALGDRGAAARTAALLQGLACRADTQPMESLCLQAAEVLLRGGNRVGLRELERLAHRGKVPHHRQEALRLALTGGGLLRLALDALADADPKVAVAAAVEVYRRTED